MSEQTAGPPRERTGERKQITAVFMDVVGFSEIAAGLDAEDLQQWLDAFYAQAREIVETYDGEVTEYLGDGVVALFGLTRSDELAAAKAVNAAMTTIKQIDAGRKQGIKMRLRIGIATGEVVVRAQDTKTNLPRAIGLVTTLARRIQEAAAPGTVLISQRTQSLLRGTIATKQTPKQMLKGFAETQSLYTPIRHAANLYIRAPAVFVGRDRELAQIAQSDQPSLIIGQAGIGKTALLGQSAQSAGTVIQFTADGVQTNSSYLPFVRWIVLQTGTTLPGYRHLRLHFGKLSEDARTALALILGLPEGQSLLTDRSSIAVKALIESSIWQAIQSKRASGFIAIEDLHWLDNASFGVLVYMLQSDEIRNYQVVLTSREDPKLDKYLGTLALEKIVLNPLNDADAMAMLDALSANNVTDHDHDALVSRAAGIPLFLEQLFKRDTSAAGGKPELPASLTALLADQIDASGAAKPVLQCASIVGRNFSVDMLSAIAASQTPLEPLLEQACAQGILQQTDPLNWAFAHALMHQATYQGMLRRTRVTYHGQIAAHLTAQHSQTVMRDPALLTEHLRLSEQHVPAIENYLKSSQWALFQGAFDDAEAHVLAAIDLCDSAPDTVDVRSLQIACHTALGSIRMQTLGFTAEPVKAAFNKVTDLAGIQNRYSIANGPAFYGSFTNAIISADKGRSDQLSVLLAQAAQSVSAEDTNQELRVASLNVDVSLHFYGGNFQQAFRDFAEFRTLYDITKHGTMIASYGVDTFAAAQMFEAVGRAICGDTHLISDLSAEMDAHQDLLNIPIMQPYAQIWGAVALFYAGRTDDAIERVLNGLAMAETQAAAFWQVTGAAWLNVMKPAQSDSDEGLLAFQQVIETHEMIGAHIGLPYFRAHYALALAKHGQFDAAYETSLRAVRENETNGLLCWYAEVLRIHADICNRSGRSNDTSTALAKAVYVATGQTAKLWLLRARLDQAELGLATHDDLSSVIDSFDAQALPPEIVAARDHLAQV